MSFRQKQGFSLVELLTVMGVIATLLVVSAAWVGRTGDAESRRAARSLILGALNYARTAALSSGEPVAMVMMPYERGQEGQLGRAFAVFEVNQDEATGSYSAERQLKRWQELPGRMIFTKGSPVASGGQNAFDQNPILSVQVKNPDSGLTSEVTMPAIVFGATGSVAWPGGGGELELHLGEGTVKTGVVMAASADTNDWRKHEVFVVGRQTGRVRYLRTE
ncbi:MAG: prepilin-type N-terminal cleavage/methylation domain-containing protein [Verrucomicrobiota bacterium]